MTDEEAMKAAYAIIAAYSKNNEYSAEAAARVIQTAFAEREAAQAARIAQLEAENARLQEANYRTFTDGLEAAAQICGSLAETTYDDADGFEAATGCEAAIMWVVKDHRKEQAAALKGSDQ